MFVETRDESRQYFVRVRRRMGTGDPLDPLERVIAGVIGDHPEYHALLDSPERAMEAEFLPQDGNTNPFLHMGLHVALQEQLQADRPSGIVELYRRMLQSPGNDVHSTEHRIMECLARVLRDAGQSGAMPDETTYLDCVRKLVA